MAKICKCKTCGKSTHAGNKCMYQDDLQMAFCPTFIRMPENKTNKPN